MIGKTVGKYRIIERLGRGGMGTVYKGIDETLDRDVAIKVLNSDLGETDILKRFRGEAVTLARLSHPGIATIYELCRQDDDLLMVMEFVRGETVHDFSERIGPLAPPQAAHVAIQVLDALGHAHRAGIVHRDLKPANLMITDTGTVKVMDFGIARVLGTERFTQGGYMMGTPAYMAPEQVLGGEIDGRADLYAVGVVLYRLLSGQLPFSADTAIAMVQKQVNDPPTPITEFRQDLPAWCTDILERVLAKSPADRFQTADEFRMALLSAVQPQALGEMPTVATPTPPGLLMGSDLTFAQSAIASTVQARGTQPRAAASAVLTPIATGAREATPTPLAAASPAPATPAPALDRTTTTVVLGRTHLVALAAVVGVLILGVAVLAVLALRRGGLPQQLAFGAVPQTTTAAAPQSTPAPAPDPSSPAPPPPASTPGDTVAPQDKTPTAPAPATPKAPAAPVGAERGVATAGSVPSSPKADGRGAASPTDGANSAAGAMAPGTGRGATPKDPGVAPAVLPPTPAAPPEPARAEIVAPVTFKDVRLLVTNGGRTRELNGVLELGDGRVTVLDKAGGSALMSLPYSAVKGAFYSRSKQPKWRDGEGKEVVGKVDLGPFSAFKSERNWLILVSHAEPVVIRLEDSGLRTILPALEERTRVKVQR